MSWPILTVGDIAAPEARSIAIGPFGSRMKADSYVPQGVPVVRGNNIVKSRSPSGDFVYITDEFADSMPGCILREGDLVFPHRGAIGEVGLIQGDASTKMMLSTSLMKLRVDRARMDPQFVYYYFSSSSGRAQLLMRASTVGTPGIGQPLSSLRSIPIPVPSLAEQRAIAATLGALDDKIESNRRAVELLQRTAAAVFTRWRSEAVTVATSTFGAYADVYGGATPKTAVPDYWGGGLAWTTPTDVTGLGAPYLFETSRTITVEGLQSCTAVMHPVGTIFMTSRATIGAFAINQVPAATNQGFIAVRPRQDADRYFLFEEMRSRIDEFLDNANGSTFLEISRGRFKELTLEVPEFKAIARLDEQLEPLHGKAAQLALESGRLATLRDALLPELLSGRMRASVKGAVA